MGRFLEQVRAQTLRRRHQSRPTWLGVLHTQGHFGAHEGVHGGKLQHMRI